MLLEGSAGVWGGLGGAHVALYSPRPYGGGSDMDRTCMSAGRGLWGSFLESLECLSALTRWTATSYRVQKAADGA